MVPILDRGLHADTRATRHTAVTIQRTLPVFNAASAGKCCVTDAILAAEQAARYRLSAAGNRTNARCSHHLPRIASNHRKFDRKPSIRAICLPGTKGLIGNFPVQFAKQRCGPGVRPFLLIEQPWDRSVRTAEE